MAAIRTLRVYVSVPEVDAGEMYALDAGTGTTTEKTSPPIKPT